MRTCIALLVCLLPLMLEASQRAVTDEGVVVILNDDGTWTPENPDEGDSDKIPLNSAVFKKPSGATFSLKSTVNDSEIWLDPKDWSFKKATSNQAAEYELQLKGRDLYAMLITEQVTIDMDKLTQIALQSAKSKAPNMRIVNREYRVVNGNKLVYMEMRGSMNGIDFTYRGYYYSDDSGTTQFVTYTGTNLRDKYSDDTENLLNGFSVQ